MLTVKVFPLGILGMNTHVLHNNTDALLIDVGENPTSVLQYLKNNHLQLQAIYITHMHFDHIFGIANILKHHTVPVYGNLEDTYLIENELLDPTRYGMPPLVVNYTVLPIQKDTTTLLGHTTHLFHTPGHTKGSICYYIPDMHSLFAGDVLFKHTIGRTDLPGGSYTQLVQSIREKLFTLPDDTLVFPGHGESTTIGHEKLYNPNIEELE